MSWVASSLPFILGAAQGGFPLGNHGHALSSAEGKGQTELLLVFLTILYYRVQDN
jgi:hypothetical protein